MDIWQWTLTKEAIAPCFVRDVLDMRDSDADFFWLGYTPCRTVLLVGMVVAIQVYDKRAIYTIDDGTAVVDCVLRHSHLAARLPPRTTAGLSTKSIPLPKKQRPDKVKTLESSELPPPITDPGYPVRVVGKVARHYQSKQILADSINPCTSSLDEIAHLERVIQLHKTKYSLAVPFVPPPKPTSRTPLPDTSTSDADASVFNASLQPHPGPTTESYTLPAPRPLQNRNRPPPIPTHNYAYYHAHSHVPSSPTARSIASSTPSSPCKPSSPIKLHEAPSKPKLRHPSRLHSRDLTANTFRLYVKHYMDNAPPPFSVPSWSFPSPSTCEDMTTPTKRARVAQGESDGDDNEVTPRPRPRSHPNERDTEPNENGDQDGPTLGFTLSHLRRVPELALLAARVVRAETRKRNKAERDKAQGSQRTSSTSTASKPNPTTNADPPRKKMKRLFSWAVVKLYEEGSIVLWNGEVRPLPVPPPPLPSGEEGTSGMWRGDSTLGSVSISTSMCGSSSVLYDLSASASLYSHYHAPRRRDGSGGDASVAAVDGDADPGVLSDPGMDEEAYVPLNARLLAGYVKEAVGVLRRGRGQGHAGGAAGGGGGREVTAEEVLAWMKRKDGRWARVGVWAVEEALTMMRTG